MSVTVGHFQWWDPERRAWRTRPWCPVVSDATGSRGERQVRAALTAAGVTQDAYRGEREDGRHWAALVWEEAVCNKALYAHPGVRSECRVEHRRAADEAHEAAYPGLADRRAELRRCARQRLGPPWLGHSTVGTLVTEMDDAAAWAARNRS